MLVNKIFDNFKVYGNLPNIQFLAGTAGNGLLLFYNRGCTQLLQAKNVYGITKTNEHWYAVEDSDSGNIVSFNIKNDLGFNYINRIKGIHKGIHQIDFVGDKLYIPNTHINSLFIYNQKNTKREAIKYKKYAAKVHPNGKLKANIHRYHQDNYAHFNSIFGRDESIYLLAHNLGEKRGFRPSQIYKIDKDGKVLDVHSIEGWNCHNIYKDSERLLICNSYENNLCDYNNYNKKVAFSCDKFTRGLAVSNEYILLGGSNFSRDKDNRYKESSIYILDHSYNLISEVKISGCQINELRFVDRKDYSLSNIM